MPNVHEVIIIYYLQQYDLLILYTVFHINNIKSAEQCEMFMEIHFTAICMLFAKPTFSMKI